MSDSTIFTPVDRFMFSLLDHPFLLIGAFLLFGLLLAVGASQMPVRDANGRELTGTEREKEIQRRAAAAQARLDAMPKNSGGMPHHVHHHVPMSTYDHSHSSSHHRMRSGGG